MADKVVLEAEIKSNIKAVSQDTKELTNNFGAFGITIGGIKDKFKDVAKIMNNGLKQVILQAKLAGVGFKKMFSGEIIGGAKTLFRVIATGVAATGIGALLIAFTALATWFTKTKVGAEALSVIFKGVGAAVNVIVDRIAKFGGGLAKILSLNIRSGLKDMASSFKGIGTEIRNDTVLAMAFEKQLQNVTDRERELNVEAANRRADIEGYKLIAEDVTKTEAERLDAAEKAFDIENDLLTSRVENAETALELETARLRLVLDPSAEQLDKLAQLEINLANIRGESTTKQIELNNKINSIESETAAKRKERHDTRMQQIEDEKNAELKITEDTAKIEEELFTARLKKQQDIELEAIVKKRNDAIALAEAEIKDADKLTERKKLINELYEEEYLKHVDKVSQIQIEGNEFTNKQIIEGEKIKLKAEQEIRNANIDSISAGLGLVKQLAGENKALMGAAIVAENITGIAKTVINTQAANVAAKAKYALIPGGQVLSAAEIASNNISAGIAIATSVAATASALSQLGSGGGGGGSSASLPSGGGGGGGGTPSPQMMSGAFDLSGVTAPEPVRAFVVTDEMTNSQNQLANIRRRATI